jgi:Zn-dependent oligopeptidase
MKLPDAQTWHKDVSMYQVKDKQNHEILGHFYLDLYPRPDKYNHAAAFALTKRALVDGKVLPAASAMVTNFNPPTADKPSLL